MVRKMLKAFIKVTADKTHFPIQITNSQYSITIRLIKSFATSSPLKLFHNTPIH